MSKEFGWYKIFIRSITETKIANEPKTKAYRFPFNSSIVFQTTTIVKAPKKAGKNLTQKNPLPNNLIM